MSYTVINASGTAVIIDDNVSVDISKYRIQADPSIKFVLNGYNAPAYVQYLKSLNLKIEHEQFTPDVHLIKVNSKGQKVLEDTIASGVFNKYGLKLIEALER